MRGFLLPALLLLAGRADAADAPVLCSLTATPLVFGQVDGLSRTPAESTATLEVSCTSHARQAAGVTLTITPLGGTMAGPEMRRMQPAHGPRYRLYVDAARTIPWGTGTNGTLPLTGSGTVLPNAPFRLRFTLYGRMPARQADVRAGNFVDGLAALLTY